MRLACCMLAAICCNSYLAAAGRERQLQQSSGCILHAKTLCQTTACQQHRNFLHGFVNVFVGLIVYFSLQREHSRYRLTNACNRLFVVIHNQRIFPNCVCAWGGSYLSCDILSLQVTSLDLVVTGLRLCLCLCRCLCPSMPCLRRLCLCPQEKGYPNLA